MSGGVESLLEEGRRYCAQRQFAQAEAVYRQILVHEPGNVPALLLLADLAMTARRTDIAVNLLARAAELSPTNADIALALGNAYFAAGEVEKAIAEYRRTIEILPAFSAAYSNLAVALIRAGRLADAIPSLRKLIELRPDFPEGHALLGNTLVGVGRFAEAIAPYQRSMVLAPRTAATYVQLAYALQTCGRPSEAVDACCAAINLGAGAAAVYNQLGIALHAADRQPEAAAAYQKALERDPHMAEAWANLGISLRNLGRPDEAAAAFQRAIGLRPTFVEAYNSLGNTLRDIGNSTAAITAYRKALEIQPDFVGARDNLIYTLHFTPGCDAQAIAAEQRKWNQVHAMPLSSHARSAPKDRHSGKLRIGYVSADFRNHVASLILLPLIRAHDRAEFEVTCYSNVRSEDDVTAQFRSAADRWRSIVALSDAAAADRIAADGIDILVDLSVHMSGNRLLVFAHRPAPIQVTYNGYPGSTGMTAMDWRLTDPYLDPHGLHDDHYAERSIRLPDSFWVYDPGEAQPIGERPIGPVTFGCLNNYAKVNPPLLALWRQIMHQIPDAKLILLCPRGGHRAEVTQSLGVSDERVEFVEFQFRQKYLETYQRIDIALDTFPYNGHITSLDAAWMGVPVISLCGQTAVSRAGFSHANNLGTTDLVAHQPDDYVHLAVELAADARRRQSLRGTLRARLKQSPLMDAPAFARHIENAYRQMWHAHPLDAVAFAD